jgi:hypothetical protein
MHLISLLRRKWLRVRMGLGLNEMILTTPILIEGNYTLPTGGWQEKRLCIAPSIVQCSAT